jgi:hypothetical protein
MRSPLPDLLVDDSNAATNLLKLQRSLLSYTPIF